MAYATPFSLPLGESQPPCQIHAVSASLPTWRSVIAESKHESWIEEKLRTEYPRFFINIAIRRLNRDVFKRLNITDDKINCMFFPSAAIASRFTMALEGFRQPIETVQFHLPRNSNIRDAPWMRFYAVLYAADLEDDAKAFWRDTGSGISSRHAEYCHEWLDYLQSSSANPSFQIQPIKQNISDLEASFASLPCVIKEREAVKAFIAELATSEQPGQSTVTSNDVFLYPGGMCAINAVSRALITLAPQPETVIYGWVYCETLTLIKRGNWKTSVHYARGSEAELDELESTLSGGKHIQALFCDAPGNPQLATPNFPRIRALADQYDFIVACDETVGTFVNIDLLPYVDILMTSLTKSFSGSADVMGGSVVVNPKSRCHSTICSLLTAQYEDTYFPLDILTLHYNSADFVKRVQSMNRTAVSVAKLLEAHPLVKQLNYPLLGPTRSNYDHCRRQNGGYGHLMSIVFDDIQIAECFYDALEIFRGTSFGNNFSVAVPFVQLALFEKQDWAESYGLSRHVIRLSVGLENEYQLLKTIRKALAKVQGLRALYAPNKADTSHTLLAVEALADQVTAVGVEFSVKEGGVLANMGLLDVTSN